MIATFVYAALGLLWAGDGLRMRRRASALSTLAPSEEPVLSSHAFITRSGLQLDDATQRAASAHARANGLLVLDLIPRELPAGRAIFMLQKIDPPRFRSDRLADALSAGEAILVDRSILDRMRLTETELPDVLSLLKLARRLKQYATTEMDFAVAPTLRAAPDAAPETRARIRLVFGAVALPIIVMQVAVALLGPWLAPVAGALALAAMHLQGALATLGTPLRPKDLLFHTLFRTLADLFGVLDPRRSRTPGVTDAAVGDPRAALRAAYAKLLAGGTTRFFEPRRAACPLCESADLHTSMSVGDLFQKKPGRFHIERCGACGHRFQNPRLSIEGLDFYYKDFYDGLGEDDLEAIFRSTVDSYRDRAAIVRGVVEPSRWLDVGTGHGHFCNVAKDLFPKTEFDGVDLGASIEEAERRRWIVHGYRALFPDIADELTAKYDVVSMSHYLEHTRDPRAEIDAAAKVLRPGGALMIEVPDPESRMGRILGRLWLPWFQPQHQHLLSAARLDALLRERGFEPAVWHRGEAHQKADFFFAAALLVHQIAPPTNRPWRPPDGALALAWHKTAWLLALPLIIAARIADALAAPLLRRAGWSNTYRVLARRGDR